MTRRGKIARLPNHIREQINSRLHDGEDGKSILAWLNALPEAQTLLANLFHGRPVSHGNLSDWRLGGYRDWLIRQDALKFAADLQNENSPGREDLRRTSDSSLLSQVTIQYAASAKALITNELEPKIRWKRLRELCVDVTLLRRAELTVERKTHENYRNIETLTHRNTETPAPPVKPT